MFVSFVFLGLWILEYGIGFYEIEIIDDCDL